MKRTIVFILSTFLFACYYDNQEDLLGENFNDCNIENLTYSNEIEPIIAESCAISGCHLPGGSGNGVFLSFEGVLEKVNNGSLKNRVVEERTMPPNAALTACEIDKISFWINQGAPNN